VSPTKKIRGDSGKEPKLHQVTEWRKKNLGINQDHPRSQFSSAQQTNKHSVITIRTASQVRIQIGSIQTFIQFDIVWSWSKSTWRAHRLKHS